MSVRYKYVPIDRIFSKLVRDLGGDVNEGDVVEWTGEALEFIGAATHYEEAVAFIEVKNHQCNLPKNLHSVIQIARDNRWCGTPADELCPATVIANLEPESNDDEPSIPVALDCNGTPINAYELAYYRPYFDFKYGYRGWSNSNYYGRRFSPVRLKNHTFFNSLVCTEDNQSLYQNCTDEYTIIQGDTVRFNFREGLVAISYNRAVLDTETGYPMIPDNISYTTAIIKYITLKMFDRQCYNGREGACGKAEKADRDWQWYCKQASNVDMMPHGIDEHQNLLDQRTYLLPRQNRYFGFFGNLSRPEIKVWNSR